MIAVTTTKRCDRCTNEVTKDEYDLQELAVGHPGCVKFFVDLCGPCSASFEEWLGIGRRWNKLRQQGAEG